MLAIITSGIAPGLALLCYFYLRDKFEVEPIGIVLRTFIIGALLVFPIMFIQYAFMKEGVLQSNWSQAYLLSGFLEEFFKWFILYFTVFQHEEFNERYDGIVYGVSVSLGFATIENILYLFANGIEFAFLRALLPVSSHALFGVVMGFYLGKGKFATCKNRRVWLSLSCLLPVVLHGTYDYILLTIKEHWLYIIIPFMIVLWMIALKKVKEANKLDEPNDMGFITKSENISN
ncbi:glutamic-type intramembrane protease PrsW [Calidifontibacillus erzurumensis]|uniref:Protease PrsW n=1 Tax=Calidifontibacillus erzurumensis TaxID=2741433 RepID=A0A8J8GH83_9BACI|nr:glutamic-type intramembrane protease PrsW [Calidifontibacillus erzurumensis]NSL53339.1 intramembrane metalloprotease PrsW [Calidifontibacillus erzurumensis]